MNELIAINYKDEKPTVSGRELHAALGVDTEYRHWFPRMCEYGFKEGKDFNPVIFDRVEIEGGREVSRSMTDHAVTLPMAKELCMLQRSEKGKQFREYFIACEEAWNSPDKIMERAMQIAHRRAVEAERRIMKLADENETLEIALNTSIQFYTVAKYNNEFKMGWNMRKCQEIGKRLSAYCRARAIEVRKCQTNDERFGETNSYPITAWQDFLQNENGGNAYDYQ
jgi:phage anti-repressor protein